MKDTFTVRLPRSGSEHTFRIERLHYKGGEPAVRLYENEGPYCTLSVFAYDEGQEYTPALVEEHPDAFFVPDYKLPDGFVAALVDAKVLEPVDYPPITLGHAQNVRAYRLGADYRPGALTLQSYRIEYCHNPIGCCLTVVAKTPGEARQRAFNLLMDLESPDPGETSSGVARLHSIKFYVNQVRKGRIQIIEEQPASDLEVERYTNGSYDTGKEWRR